jgi:hypothetical protein
MESTEGAAENLPLAFAPAVILPAQYYWALRHRTLLDGERKLMFAVLQNGLQCFLRNMGAKSRVRRSLFFEAWAWMKAKDGNGPFSFDLLCEEFGMQSSQVCKTLERIALAQGETHSAQNQANITPGHVRGCIPA